MTSYSTPRHLTTTRSLRKGSGEEYPSRIAVNWLEVAKKMAAEARALLVLNRKRVQGIRDANAGPGHSGGEGSAALARLDSVKL
jgi:hypothetical protein